MKRISYAILSAFAAVSVHALPITSPKQTLDITTVKAFLTPQIFVDFEKATVNVNKVSFDNITVGNEITISLKGVGDFSYVVDQIINSTDVREVSGHIKGSSDQSLFIGVGKDGLSGFIKTPKMTYAIGHSNKIQYFGESTSKFMAESIGETSIAMQVIAPLRGGIPPVNGAEAVDISLSTLSAMGVGDSTSMQIPGFGYTKITFDSLTPNSTSTTWVGILKDFGDSYKAILTYSPHGVEGIIFTPMGEVNITTGADSQIYMFNPTLLGLKNGMAEGGACASTPDLKEMVSSTTPVMAQATTASNTIDVLFYYTPGMLSAYGSLAGVTTRVDSLVALSNQAYAAGKLPHSIRKVGLELLNTPDNTNNSALLSKMQSRLDPFTGLAAKQNEKGADLVSVIRPFYASAQGMTCGVAYVGGYNGSDITLQGNNGLSVISDGVDKGGQGYYCDNLTLVHELGHNMGLMHDRATVAKQGGGSGVKPYAFGYVPPTAKWGTIMSYTFPHLPNFSSPTLAVCNGSEVCGVSQTASNSADNLAALSFSMPLVASYRTDVALPMTYTVSGVFSVDNAPVSGATVKLSNISGGDITKVSCTTTGVNGVYSCNAPKGYSFTMAPSYTLPNGAAITWTPSSNPVSALSGNVTSNFSGYSSNFKYLLTGATKLNGSAVSGVSFNITGVDAAKVSCTTSNSLGSYSCSAPAKSSFTVSPVLTVVGGSTPVWVPANTSVSSMSSNATTSFSGTSVISNYKVSGVITITGGTPYGLQIKVTGADAAKVKCSSPTNVGAYTCTAPKGSNFVLSPTMIVTTGATLVWTPASITVSSISGNVVASFKGTLSLPKKTLTLISTINGVASTTMPYRFTTTGTVSSISCSMGADKLYKCVVPSSYTIKVTPASAQAGLTFTPSSITVPSGNLDATLVFTGKIK